MWNGGMDTNIWRIELKGWKQENVEQKKQTKNISLKKAERNENIQMEPGCAWRFQITKTMKNM